MPGRRGRTGTSSLRRSAASDDRQGRLFGDEGQVVVIEPGCAPAFVMPPLHEHDMTSAATPPAAPTASTERDDAPPHADRGVRNVRDIGSVGAAGESANDSNVARPADIPVSFEHPEATRRVRLNGVDIGYAFARGRRRSIGMVVGPEGLSVRAPRWVSLREVEAALHERAAWIVKHLAGQRERAAQAREREGQWRDGGTVRVFGAPVTLVVDPSVRGCLASWQGMHPPAGAELRVGVGHRAAPRAPAATTTAPDAGSDAPRDAIREAVETWLRTQARALFAQRCALYAPRLAVQLTRLSIGSARTRWGSAGVDGSIRLNWRLMHHPLACIDYVVVHELAHLRHMNHGPAFWRLVESVLPDHRATRKLLRDDAMSE
jgi:hypothetical protein